MKLFIHSILCGVLFYAVPNLAQIQTEIQTRAMNESERTQLKALLDSVLKNNQDECYVNISNFNNIDVLTLPAQKQKTYIDQNTKEAYVRGRLSSTLNLNVTEPLLPEGTISFDVPSRFTINYIRPVSLNVVEISYADIQTQNFAQGHVVHHFETRNGQPAWTQSTVNIVNADTNKAHIRCKAKGDFGFGSAKSTTPPIKSGSFIFLDLELAAPEYCLTKCTEPL